MGQHAPVGQQCVPAGVEALAFDVGETLVDESREWAYHAREVGTYPFTLVATLGTGYPARPVLPTLSDFYPDAVECLRAARVFCSAVTGQDV